MTSFLFWNLRGNPIAELVATLAWQNQVDVIMLAECSISPEKLLLELNKTGAANYHYAPGIVCRKIHVFASFPAEYIKPVYETDRLTVRNLQLPGLTDVLIAIVHFISKTNWSTESQAMEVGPLANDILLAEKQMGHSRTILVGDLNMNPFEYGVVSASGLNAVMSRRVAERGKRTVQSRDYPFFYNPMWGLLGDAGNKPPGTYYYPSAEHVVYFWNMFDQLLLRPEILPHFDLQDLAIVTMAGSRSLLTETGLPESDKASDHLPILFQLKL